MRSVGKIDTRPPNAVTYPEEQSSTTKFGHTRRYHLWVPYIVSGSEEGQLPFGAHVRVQDVAIRKSSSISG